MRASWADTILMSAVETQINKLVAEAAQSNEKEEKPVLLSASQCDRTQAWPFPFYGVRKYEIFHVTGRTHRMHSMYQHLIRAFISVSYSMSFRATVSKKSTAPIPPGNFTRTMHCIQCPRTAKYCILRTPCSMLLPTTAPFLGALDHFAKVLL